MVSRSVVELFHRRTKPAVCATDVLANFGQIGNPQRGTVRFDHVHHVDTMELQLVIVQLEFLLRPIECLVHEVYVLEFHRNGNLENGKVMTGSYRPH